jgi:hypothetical protein
MWNEAAALLPTVEGATPFRLSDPPGVEIVVPDLATRADLGARIQPDREFSGERNDFSEYVVFRGKDRAAATAFLKLVKIGEPGIHVVVETPEGHWGRDTQGMYHE